MESLNIPLDYEFIIDYFEALLEKNNIIKNGIIFTPKYIAEFIYNEAIKEYNFSVLPKIIDPSCGCGIFLAVSTILLKKETNLSFKDIYKNCIYGLEIDKDNARRCKVVLHLLPVLYGESNKGIEVNIKGLDSLKANWSNEFNVDGFDYIIGNPPYVNTHDMDKVTATFLKNTFRTTQSGVYNIFYAFIEHAYKFLNKNGLISYIVPNNFLTIKSATNLRLFMLETRCLKMILDFSSNMVFKPIRTYNCIIQLTKNKNDNFKYCVMEKCENIDQAIQLVSYDEMELDKLDAIGWKLVDRKTRNNISKIENQFISIKGFIRTGIATLKDDVYIVDKDDNGYYKIFNNERYYLESTLVKRLYKIPELKKSNDLDKICRYIIFPYKKGVKGFSIIEEEELQTEYPLIYSYLLARKHELDTRDKGKPNSITWYAYGRSQGLNKYGKKLLFPTFADIPRFTLVNDEFAFFCNGYAVFENDSCELDILLKVLNSTIMDYYIKNTSYAIEGGYYCYQKKYIEKFSLPLFDKEEKEQIRKLSDEALNEYLFKKYELK